jgi:hypothetical protein
MGRSSRAKQLRLESLEDRSLMAGDLGANVLRMPPTPRVPPNINVPNIVANVLNGIRDWRPPIDRPENVEPGELAGRIVAHIKRDLDRAGAALAHLVDRLGDPTEPLSPEIHAALTRVSEKAQAIADRAAGAIIGGDEGGDPAIAAAADANRVGGNFFPGLRDRLILRTIEGIGRQLERIDERLGRLLEGLDDEVLESPAVQSALGALQNSADAIVAQLAPYLATPPSDPGDPPTDPPPIPQGLLRELSAVAVHTRFEGLRLRGALHLVGDPSDEISQPITDALAGISDAAQSIVDRVSPLVTTEPAPVVAAARPDANNVGANRPAPSEETVVRVLTSIKNSLTRLDEKLAAAIERLDPAAELAPAVERLLALILHGAENIVADVEPYLEEAPPEE